jgi:hypothetical protein
LINAAFFIDKPGRDPSVHSSEKVANDELEVSDSLATLLLLPAEVSSEPF